MSRKGMLRLSWKWLMRALTRATCPDCWGQGIRTQFSSKGYETFLCKLCRGTGRID